MMKQISKNQGFWQKIWYHYANVKATGETEHWCNYVKIKAVRELDKWWNKSAKIKDSGKKLWYHYADVKATGEIEHWRHYVKVKAVRELTNDDTNQQKSRIPAKNSDTTMLMPRLQEKLNIDTTMLRSRPSENWQMMQQISKNQGFWQKTLIPLC